MRTIRKNNVSPFRSPKHIRWDRQRSDQELLHVATEYGKCWNPQHWHELTQGYYDGFDDARTEYRRRQDEDLAATKERYRAEIEELKANWIRLTRQKQLSRKFMRCAKSAMNSSNPWTCFAKLDSPR